MKYKRKEINREICAGIDNNIFSVFVSGAYLPAFVLMAKVETSVGAGIFDAVDSAVEDSWHH